MPKRIRGVVLSSDGAAPQSGVVVEAFDPSTSFTQGEETTDERGQFILADLQERSWIARRKSGSGDIQIQVVTEAIVVEDVHGQRSNLGAHEYKHLRNIPSRFIDPVLTALVDRLGSSGWISGGVVSDGGGNTVDVASGTGLFRAEDDETDTLELLPWGLSEGLSVPSDTTRYIGVEYSSGSPQAVVETTESAFDGTTSFHLATVVNEGGSIHIDSHRTIALNHALRNQRMLEEVFHIQRAIKTGGVILGETGARNVTVSPGFFYVMTDPFAVGDIDTSGADRFDGYYDNGSGFTKVADQSQWPNTQYNTGGGLSDMTNNRWGNNWFYLETDNSLVMLYPQAQYVTEGQAEEEAPPSAVPDRVSEHAMLIGRMIFQKSASTATVQSVFATVFAASGVVDHGNLDGLSDDDHTQYLLVAGSRPLSGDWDNIGRRIRNTGTIEVSDTEPSTPATGLGWLDTSEDGEPAVLQVDTITSHETLTSAFTVVLCDATSGVITVTLPAAADNEGRRYFIKKIDSSANAVTIDGNASETIDDSTTKVLSSQYDSAEIVCDGTEWWII